MPCALILHNIRSAYNVGSIFRSADAAGVQKIYLTGYTPAPKDRFGRARKDIAKVALGAEKNIAWEQARSISSAIKKLEHEGFHILALEQCPKAVSLFAFKTAKSKKIALMLGNEVRGLSSSALRRADYILEIPMHGKKESLNVSVAAGIALFMLRAKARS